MNNQYQRCVSCVMDTSDPTITFDTRGVCDHCNTFFRSSLKTWKPFSNNEALVKRLLPNTSSQEYDCLIGLSGGVDSSYLAYYVTEVLRLRPLVFHVDAGWNSELAVSNIERIVDGLGLDLYTEVIDWPTMRDLQLAFFKSGVSHIDTPQDHAFFATLYKYASKFNIKTILTGGNLSTEGIRNPVQWMYYQSDSVQLRAIHARHGTHSLSAFPQTSVLWHKLYLPFFKNLRVFRPLDSIPYIKEDAVELLKSKFGWKSYSQKHFESRFTRFYESFWLPTRFGIDVRKVQFSSLILTGQMRRSHAISILSQPPWDHSTINNDLNFIAKKLQITTEELLSYLHLPLKTHRDYSSQSYLYHLGSSFYKLLNLGLGEKR